MAKKKSGPGFKAKKGNKSRISACRTRRIQRRKEAKEVNQGLERICTQLSSLGVTAADRASAAATETPSTSSGAEAFKKSPSTIAKDKAKFDAKLAKSLSSLDIEEPAAAAAVPAAALLDDLPVNFVKYPDQKSFYERQREEYKAYKSKRLRRREGDKLRRSRRAKGATYELLQALNDDTADDRHQ